MHEQTAEQSGDVKIQLGKGNFELELMKKHEPCPEQSLGHFLKEDEAEEEEDARHGVLWSPTSPINEFVKHGPHVCGVFWHALRDNVVQTGVPEQSTTFKTAAAKATDCLRSSTVPNAPTLTRLLALFIVTRSCEGVALANTRTEASAVVLALKISMMLAKHVSLKLPPKLESPAGKSSEA